MDNFFVEEKLATDDYKCEKCKRKTRATKILSVGKTPKYLVIHLKRFKMFPRKTKISNSIDYPIELSIKDYLHNNQSGPYKY